MTSKRNKLEDLLQHLDSSTAMQQRIPDAVRERILNNVIKETNDAEVEAPRKSDSAHPAMDPVRRNRRWQWPALAAALAAIVMAVILPTRILQAAPAVLEDSEGKRNIQYNELVRPSGDRSAMLSMRDGSRVETRSMSEFSLERTSDGGTRIRLKEGGLIVDASAENRTNLYVETKDIKALVSGAVSLIKADEEGSRIAAIGGEIRVQQGTMEKKLRSGEQVATSPLLELVPMKEELTWSRQAVEHVAMLEQAQSSLSGSPAPAARPKFAAASVRPVPISPLIVNGFKCLGVDGLLWESRELDPRAAPPGVTIVPLLARRGRCSGQVVDLAELVQGAYGTVRHQPALQRMAGLSCPCPFYQIEAVADDPEHVTKGELKLMLQSLLEDRFKARVHLETRDVDGYALTIAKSGIKFKEASGDATAGGGAPAAAPGPRRGTKMDDIIIGLGGGAPAAAPGPRRGGGPPPCEARTIRDISVRGKCGMGKVTEFLKTLLMLGAAPPIDDRTGLMGTYNIEFALEEVFLSAPTGPGPRGTASPQPRQFNPPVAKALEEQLGLHLERVKVPAEFVVVDHIEQPTEN
jgi:uncharacterized protein (TIGR03435 family)